MPDDQVPAGFPGDPDAVIAHLLARFPSKWMAIVCLCNDVILEIEQQADIPADDPALPDIEREVERQTAELRALSEWAWRRHADENYPRNVDADGDYLPDDDD